MQVNIEKGQLAVKFEYDPLIILRMRTTPGNYHNSITKTWYLPLETRNISMLGELGFDITHLQKQVQEQRKQTADEYKIIYRQIKEMFPFLRKYQIECATKGFINGDLLNADDVGLGKTFEALATGLYRIKNNGIKRIVVCCPASIKWQWRDVIKDYFGEDSLIIKGQPHVRRQLYKKDAKIVIINYEQVVSDFKYIEPLTKWQMLVLDEATYVKNRKANRTKKVMQLTPRYVLALTGTPVETKLEDAWLIGNIVHPGWMSQHEFESNYVVWGEKRVGRYTFKEKMGYKNIPQFMEKMMEIGIRRTEEDVRGELPPRIVYERKIPMSKYQKHLEGVIIENIQGLLENDRKRAIKEYVLLQMLANSTELIKLSEARSLQHLDKEGIDTHCPKLDELMHTLDELSDKKILIFTRFKKMAYIIQRTINDAFPGECTICTSDTKDKEIAVKDFRDKYRFMVATDVFTYGVDMPFVTTVVNYDIHWNHAKLKQRVGRMRRNTTKKVFNMVSEGVEEYIYEKMKAGGDLFEQVMAFDINEQLTKYITRRG